jgi:hypothetical protein
MSDDQAKRRSEADAQLEREIRMGRPFSLADAIGQMAGPGIMKGVSPVTGRQQAEAEIQGYLGRHLVDPAGVLSVVLVRQVNAGDLLLNQFDRPLVALASHVRRVLECEYLLKELVREADVEWGRVLRERPFFEKEGCLPHPDDPYTAESVRTCLSQLLAKVTAGAT